MDNDLIAAPATPPGVSALSVVRTDGAGAVEAIAELSDRAETIREAGGGRLIHARLLDPATDEPIDEVVLGIYRAPKSYTGDDAVEISCHGSPAGVQRILELLYRSGFRPAEPGEFTERAFLAGKLDLTRAEAVHEIVKSQTSAGHRMALNRLAGSVERAIDAQKRKLVDLSARVAIQLDYPEEETGEIPISPAMIDDVKTRLAEIAATYRTGRLYQEGARVVFAGRTNAGKSSLFNAFLREERSIVSADHGTTRDYIETRVELSGVPVMLYDTAGLRSAVEAIEGEGIRRTREVLEAADLVVYVVDGEVGVTEEDRTAITDITRPTVFVWNKIDVADVGEPPNGFTGVSALTRDGLGRLIDAVSAAIAPEQRAEAGTPVIDSSRQKSLIERAVAALEQVGHGLEQGMPVDAISVDVQEAINALGEITGEVTSEDVLDAVFRGFCVGK